MAVTGTQVKYDIGEVWDAITGTTTTIINSFITKAELVVSDIVGSTTDMDIAVRSLADAFAVGRVLGGLGPATVADKNMQQMRDDFRKDAENSLRVKGYTIDGLHAKFEQVNP